ncbi:MAG: DNA-3-methyladenine glycosylase [Vicingaceae bacterium]
MKLSRDFYIQDDTLKIAQQLLGKILCTKIDGKYCSGVICETEAYLGANDKASHAHRNRFTERTKIMYAEGGVAYVYLCYGIHHLFNIVTGKSGDPQAVLVRAIVPIEGKEFMLERRNQQKLKPKDYIGPGKVSQALGLSKAQNGLSLTESQVWIEDREINVDSSKITASARIGIDYAEEDAELPYRFQYFDWDF